MTYWYAQSTSDVVISTIWIHTLFAKALIDLSSTHFFISVSLTGLLGMLVASLNFDLIVATLMGDSVVASSMLRDCLMMIYYRKMLVNLILLDFQDFDVILGMDWLASYNASIDCLRKKVMFSILGQLEFSFKGKHVGKPLRMILTLWASSLLRKGCQDFLSYVVSDENDLPNFVIREGGGVYHWFGTKNNSYL